MTYKRIFILGLVLISAATTIFVSNYLIKKRQELRSKAQETTTTYNIWDNGLTRRCVKTGDTPTAQFGQKPLFEDTSECLTTDPIFGQSSWILGLQSESTYGETGLCKNFPAINSPNSPATFEWLNQGSLTAHLKLDLTNVSHPCGANYFNWYTFMNPVPVGVIYPKPDELISQHRLRYTTTGENGVTRLIAGMSGFAITQENQPPTPFTIEISLNLDSTWGDNYPNSPLISTCTPDQGCNSYYFFLDGSYFGYQVPKNQETSITIDWSTIYRYLLDQNLLEPPLSFTSQHLSTGGVSLGFEVKNLTQTNSSTTDLYQSDFYITSKSQPTPTYGWDPGFNKRRAATFKLDSSYFESCPDDTNGCRGNIPNGGGFYTLAPDMGTLGIPCQVNSGSLFDSGSPAGTQTCPFYFNWGTTDQHKPSAILNLNTTNWTSSATPNIYLGFQENTPYADFYMGSSNLPSIDNHHYSAQFSATVSNIELDTQARVRFLTGTAWYVPGLNKSFVLELNLDAVNEQYQPEWSTTEKAVRNTHCAPDVLCLYLGGRSWGYSSFIGQGPTSFIINWADIAQKLVQDGYLPPEAIGPYPANVYSGPEILGRANVTMEVSQATIYGLSPVSSSTPSPTPTPSPFPTPESTPTPPPTSSPTPSPTPCTGSACPTSSTPGPTAQPTPTGDIDDNGSVNILDYTLLFENFGQSPPDNVRADINNDGAVNILDYSLLFENFGEGI